MKRARYDASADFYDRFVKASLDLPTSVLTVVTDQTVKVLGDIVGLRVCDVACGQGHLARRLAAKDAIVTGVDISVELLKRAREQTPKDLAVTYLHGDAQRLEPLATSPFDLVVINMALMDIPDHKSAFEHCHRILKSAGRFVFSVLHPCFESPFDPDNPPVEVDAAGNFLAVRISRYLTEGHWTSGGDGVRGRVGAYHRTLSTYLNDLLSTGFQLEALYEPVLPSKTYDVMEDQWFSKIPKGLVVKAVKV